MAAEDFAMIAVLEHFWNGITRVSKATWFPVMTRWGIVWNDYCWRRGFPAMMRRIRIYDDNRR